VDFLFFGNLELEFALLFGPHQSVLPKCRSTYAKPKLNGDDEEQQGNENAKNEEQNALRRHQCFIVVSIFLFCVFSDHYTQRSM
jgi:hypothetical protein